MIFLCSENAYQRNVHSQKPNFFGGIPKHRGKPNDSLKAFPYIMMNQLSKVLTKA